MSRTQNPFASPLFHNSACCHTILESVGLHEPCMAFGIETLSLVQQFAFTNELLDLVLQDMQS